MNSFCPFTGSDCRSDCVFRTHTTIANGIETTCRLALAATTVETYCDLKLREMEDNTPNPHQPDHKDL